MINLFESFEDAVNDFKMDQALIIAREIKCSESRTKYDDLQVDALLHEMIAWNRMDAVELLLEIGVSPNGKDTGDTPLNSAVLMMDQIWNKEISQELIIEYIKKLLNFGADLELEGSNGWPPLFWAVCRNLREVTLFLLEHGADPNHQSTLDNDYPIEAALFEKNAEIGLLLLSYDADPFKAWLDLGDHPRKYQRTNLIDKLKSNYQVENLVELKNYFNRLHGSQ